MKTIFSILLSLAVFSILKSQTFTVISATSQEWAGAVCCSSGTNYQISISCENTDKKITFDTLWINYQPFVLDEKDGRSVICTKSDEKTFYSINAGVSYNQYGDYDSDKIIEKEKKPVVKVPVYKGEALVIYHVNKQRMVLEIPTIKELAPLAYP